MEQLHADDPTTIGPYRVIARLGAGGMGMVFLCITAGGRRLAVKVIRPELADDPVFRARFRQEAAAARLVRGHVTATVIDADTESPSPWLATAYLEGPTLLEAAAKNPLALEALRRLAASLAEALQCIHDAGLVHRDLKPSNIILTADGPRVVDFGIARAADATVLSATNIRVGTPGYIAPEQIRGESASWAADVFSLGAVLVYAATGAAPFGEGPVEAVLYRILHKKPDLQRVPPGLRELVGQCLADDPADRPTAQQVLVRSGHPFATATASESHIGHSSTLLTALPTTTFMTSSAPAGRWDAEAGPPTSRHRRRRRGGLALALSIVAAASGAWATQHWIPPSAHQPPGASITTPPTSRAATPTTTGLPTPSTSGKPEVKSVKTASPSPSTPPSRSAAPSESSAPAQVVSGGYRPVFDPASRDCKPRRLPELDAQWQVSAPPYSVKDGDFVELNIRDKFGNLPDVVTYLQPLAMDVEVIHPDGSSQLAHTFIVSDREGAVTWPRDFAGAYPRYDPGTYTVVWTEATDSLSRTTPRPRFLACYGFTVDGPTDAGCSATVKVGPKTSCAFALNVEAAWLAAKRSEGYVDAFSPVTNKTYSMYCDSARPTVCSRGVDAVVYIYR